MTFTADQLQDFVFSSNLEWLETNGIGGYASGTVAGTNSRRYHGLLVAATKPPLGRMVVLSKLEETIVVGDNRVELSSNQFPGAVHPEGHKYLRSFRRDVFPEFEFQAGDFRLKKTIAAIHGENTTVIVYEVLDAPEEFNFELLPLYACKDFHSEARANDSLHFHYLFDDDTFRTMNYQECPELFITVPGSTFIEQRNWHYNFEHLVEHYRGLDFKEDLYSHGRFSVKLKKGARLGIIVSTEAPLNRDAVQLLNDERVRRNGLIKKFDGQEALRRLALAADQFIVKRGELHTIIAGYPWFSDWGRDTMISLPGLCLVTGRHEEYKQILTAFADHISDGMIPNRFPDYDETPEYNTIDATLWFFVAVYKYYQATSDKAFLKPLMPVLKDIIDWHYRGTRYNICVDADDELLGGGHEGVQLTWMDVKVKDWVVTPRRTKPVEINALWYNTLMAMSHFQRDVGSNADGAEYERRASRVLASFNEKFWNSTRKCLYDCIDNDYKYPDMRPNQVFAISLPFPLLSKERATAVLKMVGQYLLTTRGLRSLEQSHHDYKGNYSGDVWNRDCAYHQGTVWSYLIGPYIDALMFVKGENGRKEASALFSQFLLHLDERGVGTISEIFDGDTPHRPEGCIAQAWGVAEALRVAVEHKLVRLT
jgi:predicted glycogen debranching enzyme